MPNVYRLVAASADGSTATLALAFDSPDQADAFVANIRNLLGSSGEYEIQLYAAGATPQPDQSAVAVPILRALRLGASYALGIESLNAIERVGLEVAVNEADAALTPPQEV